MISKGFKYLLGLLAVLGISFSGKAQIACFTFVGDSVGCAPFTVRVQSCASPGANISFNFIWKLPLNPFDYQVLPPGESEMTYTYTQPGEYIIEQLRGGIIAVQRKVRVFNAEALPAFTWTTCNDSLKITFTDTVFSAYSFFPGDGNDSVAVLDKSRTFRYKYSFSGSSATFPFAIRGIIPRTCNKSIVRDTVTLYAPNQAPKTDSLVGMDTLTYRIRFGSRADEAYLAEQNLAGNPGWQTRWTGISRNDAPQNSGLLSLPETQQKSAFRMATLTGCGQRILTPELLQVWPRTQPENQKITVTWPSFSVPDAVEISLLRNGQVVKNLIGLADTFLVDEDNLVCGSTYCYQIRIKRQVTGYAGQLVYVSAPICTQAISNRPPDPVKWLTASVIGNGIELKGEGSPLAKTYEIFRKEKDDIGFEKWGESNSLPVLDTTALTSTTAYCYRISFRDICGNTSLPGDSICPILLRLNRPDDSRKDFFWSALEGWKGGVANYELIRTPEASASEAENVGTALSYVQKGRDTKKQKIRYQIRANARQLGLYPEPSYSNEIEVVQEPKLFFPDVFTPNEDGQNETFRCYSLFLKAYELRIYNAWGNIIYASQKPEEGWKGTIDGQPAPAGPYAYYAKGTDETGNTLETRGFFNLVR